MRHYRLISCCTLLLGVLVSHRASAEDALPTVLVPAPTSATAQPNAPRDAEYTVRRGDTLDRILVRHFGVPAQALKAWRAQVVAHNPTAFKGRNPNRLMPGSRLYAPPDMASLRQPLSTPLPTPERPRAAIYYYGH